MKLLRSLLTAAIILAVIGCANIGIGGSVSGGSSSDVGVGVGVGIDF